MERAAGRRKGGACYSNRLHISWHALICVTQIIVVNYEDRQTTMYAPEDDEASYKYASHIAYKNPSHHAS